MSLYLTNSPTLKIKISAILLFFMTCSALLAQEGLLVKNKKTGRAWMYEKYARVTYIRVNEIDYHTGILNALLDSSVIFGMDTIPINEIAGLRRKNPAHTITRALGVPFMLIGSIFMGQGVTILIDDADSDRGIKNILLGAGLFAIGYIPYELSLQDLTVGAEGKWELQIQKGKPLD